MSASKGRTWLGQFPPLEWASAQLRELVLGALRQGPIPEHVAFVMDGNRRFARNRHIETVEGHHLGFEALARVLEVCYKAGVRVVSIYAFSIENFQRPKHEVEGLMALAKLKLTQLAQHGDLLSRYGASIRILGQRELIRPDVLEVVEQVEALTANNGDAVLNVCFPYTSRDEMTHAVRSVVQQWSQPVTRERPFSAQHIKHTIRSRHLSATAAARVSGAASPASASSDADDGALSSASTLQASAGQAAGTSDAGEAHSDRGGGRSEAGEDKLAEKFKADAQRVFPSPEDITPALLSEHMHTAGMPPLDLLVRTSGVHRFSDFMLWQAHESAEVAFAECLWPEFDVWHFVPILVEWQWRRRREARERKRGGRRAKDRGKVLKAA